jgi:hypothetical protein
MKQTNNKTSAYLRSLLPAPPLQRGEPDTQRTPRLKTVHIKNSKPDIPDTK